jgi:MraZ protein
VFQGSHLYRIDDKGRLKMPADFVYALGSMITITRGWGKCLWLLPQQTWDDLVLKLKSDRLLDERALTLRRRFIGPAETSPLDAQGRLTIPTLLRQYAGISHEVVLMGLDDKIEIWAAEVLLQYDDDVPQETIIRYADELNL